tara:strand:+ start:121 stop:717 length:597 start_codon:yes stop_codon:yes gene_type:complete
MNSSLKDRKGHLETTNTLEKAKVGDFLVSNTRTPFNESYIVSFEVFHANYDFVSSIPDELSGYNAHSVWAPKGKSRFAVHMTGRNAELLNQFCLGECGSRHLSQEQLKKFMCQPVHQSEVQKDAEVLAHPLSQHLIDVFKSMGGLKTFVSEKTSALITLIEAPWAATQPLYEEDWLIIGPDGYYVVAKNEFDLTYSTL